VVYFIAYHGGERLSQELLVQMGGLALSEALSTNPQETQELFMGAYGPGSQIGVLLPYCRIQESEADHSVSFLWPWQAVSRSALWIPDGG